MRKKRLNFEIIIFGLKNLAASFSYFKKSGKFFKRILAAVNPQITPPPDQFFASPAASPQTVIVLFRGMENPQGIILAAFSIKIILFFSKKSFKKALAVFGLDIIPYSVSEPCGIFQINPFSLCGQISTKLSKDPLPENPKIPSRKFGLGNPKFFLVKESAPSHPIILSYPLGKEEIFEFKIISAPVCFASSATNLSISK